MTFAWDESRQAFAAAADWFAQTTAAADDRWHESGLGEWDVRSLVGHTSRSLLTVEEYLNRPAASVEVESAAGYFRATRAAAVGSGVAQRGHDAGAALGPDPVAGIAALVRRVVPLVDTRDGRELVTTFAGGMRLADYLPTRTFELVVHTGDLAVALGRPIDAPSTAAAQALQVVAELALTDGLAGRLLLAATGRPIPPGFSVL